MLWKRLLHNTYLLGRWKRWTCLMVEDVPISRLSLRFNDAGLEGGFRSHLARRAPLNFFKFNSLVFLFCALYVAVYDYGAQGQQPEVLRRFSSMSVLATALLALSGLVGAALAGVQMRWRLLSPLSVDILIILVWWFQIVLCVFTEVWYLAKLCGVEDPRSAFGTTRFSDAWLVLAFDISVTVLHFIFVLRWVAICPCALLGSAIYPVVCVTLGSPEISPWSLWLTLFCLVIVSAHGKRDMEIKERRAFIQVVRERTLRAETEFRMNSFAAAGVNPRRMETEAASSQLVDFETHSLSSMGSGCLFEDLGASGLPTRLQDFHRLGLRQGWLLAPESMQMAPNQVLGRGSFGVVVAGKYHGTPVAVKVSLNSTGKPTDVATLVNELRILRHVRHMNIAGFHGAVSVNKDLALVLEVVHGPSLERYIEEKSGDRAYDSCHRFWIVLGICRALRYLHGHLPPVLHGDLKPANVLLEQRGFDLRPKLVDFGLSRIMKRSTLPLGGSLMWTAPELVSKGGRQSRPDPALDVFSFGRLVRFIITGQLPLSRGISRGPALKALVAGFVPSVEWPGGAFGLACQELAEKCCAFEPRDRPSSQNACLRIESWALDSELSPSFASTAQASGEGAPSPPCCVSREDLSTASQFQSWSEAMRAIREAGQPPPSRAGGVVAMARTVVHSLSPKSTPRLAGSPVQQRDPRLPPLAEGEEEFSTDGSVGSAAAVGPKQAPVLEAMEWPAPATQETAAPGTATQEAAAIEAGPFMPTPSATQLVMTLDLMQRWQSSQEDVTRHRCCAFHRQLNMLRKVVEEAAHFRCDHIKCAHWPERRQCETCLSLEGQDQLALETPESLCGVCGGELRASSPAPTSLSL